MMQLLLLVVSTEVPVKGKSISVYRKTNANAWFCAPVLLVHEAARAFISVHIYTRLQAQNFSWVHDIYVSENSQQLDGPKIFPTKVQTQPEPDL